MVELPEGRDMGSRKDRRPLELVDAERDMLAAIAGRDSGYVTAYGAPEHKMALALEAKRLLKVEGVGPASYKRKHSMTGLALVQRQ